MLLGLGAVVWNRRDYNIAATEWQSPIIRFRNGQPDGASRRGYSVLKSVMTTKQAARGQSTFATGCPRAQPPNHAAPEDMIAPPAKTMVPHVPMRKPGANGSFFVAITSPKIAGDQVQGVAVAEASGPAVTLIPARRPMFVPWNSGMNLAPPRADFRPGSRRLTGTETLELGFLTVSCVV